MGTSISWLVTCDGLASHLGEIEYSQLFHTTEQRDKHRPDFTLFMPGVTEFGTPATMSLFLVGIQGIQLVLESGLHQCQASLQH